MKNVKHLKEITALEARLETMDEHSNVVKERKEYEKISKRLELLYGSIGDPLSEKGCEEVNYEEAKPKEEIKVKTTIYVKNLNSGRPWKVIGKKALDKRIYFLFENEKGIKTSYRQDQAEKIFVRITAKEAAELIKQKDEPVKESKGFKLCDCCGEVNISSFTEDYLRRHRGRISKEYKGKLICHECQRELGSGLYVPKAVKQEQMSLI